MRGAIRVTLSAATFAVSIAALAVTPVQAQKQFGAAGVLCSQYIKGARTSDIVYHQASNWLLGYVSGMNAAQSANGAAPVVNLTQRPSAEIGGRLLRGQSIGDHRQCSRPVVCDAAQTS